jgi:hypothetical protein
MEANGDKSTPLDYAENGGHARCSEILKRYGGVNYTTMRLYAVVLIQQVRFGACCVALVHCF